MKTTTRKPELARPARTPRVSTGTGWITPVVATHLKKTARPVRVSTGTGWISPTVSAHLKKTAR